MFDGQLEKIKKKKNGSIATVENFLTELENARNDADEIEDECLEAIDELKEVRDDAAQVSEFVDRVTSEW